MRWRLAAGVAALALCHARGAAAGTLATGLLQSTGPSDFIGCYVTNVDDQKTLPVHVELIDGSGAVQESGDLQVPPRQTLQVSATQTLVNGRWCRVDYTGGRSRLHAELVLFDGTRDAVALEAR